MSELDRRTFLQRAAALTATASPLSTAAFAAKAAKTTGKVIGANDRINVGVIGCGGRGTYVAKEFAKAGETRNARIAQVCDVYQKRVNANAEAHNVKGTLDFHDILNNPDIDAVLVATPDHWHAPHRHRRDGEGARTSTWKSPCAIRSRKPGCWSRP